MLQDGRYVESVIQGILLLTELIYFVKSPVTNSSLLRYNNYVLQLNLPKLAVLRLEQSNFNRLLQREGKFPEVCFVYVSLGYDVIKLSCCHCSPTWLVSTNLSSISAALLRQRVIMFCRHRTQHIVLDATGILPVWRVHKSNIYNVLCGSTASWHWHSAVRYIPEAVRRDKLSMGTDNQLA